MNFFQTILKIVAEASFIEYFGLKHHLRNQLEISSLQKIRLHFHFGYVLRGLYTWVHFQQVCI